MRYARFPISLLTLLAPLVAVGPVSAAATAIGPLADNRGLIHAREQVPDDPLAGLPSEDSGRPSRPSKVGKATSAKAPATCSVDGKPANNRDVGDLRATLALVQRGPRYLACPPDNPSAGIGLRVTVDETGKITAAEPVGGAAEVSEPIAKRLSGKSIAARREGATTGTVWLVFTPNKTR